MEGAYEQLKRLRSTTSYNGRGEEDLIVHWAGGAPFNTRVWQPQWPGVTGAAAFKGLLKLLQRSGRRPPPVPLYRGLRLPHWPRAGDVLQSPLMASFTDDYMVAQRFSRRGTVLCLLPEDVDGGTRVLSVDDYLASPYGEREYVLPPGRLRVLRERAAPFALHTVVDCTFEPYGSEDMWRTAAVYDSIKASNKFTTGSVFAL